MLKKRRKLFIDIKLSHHATKEGECCVCAYILIQAVIPGKRLYVDLIPFPHRWISGEIRPLDEGPWGACGIYIYIYYLERV